jgi:hypothetical protein
MDAEILLDEPLTGVAERVDELAGLDDDELAARLAADGVHVPVERGLPGSVQRLVARLRGRRLLDDLGEAPSSFELLALHVPPGGRGALDLGRSSSSDRQVSLSALGFGFGGGRKLTIAVNESIAERSSCMRVLQHVVLHVRRFSVPGDDGGGPLVTTDVVSYGMRELRAWADCPYCRIGGEPDPFDFDVDSAAALDLTGYDAEVKREETVSLEGRREADVGLDVPVPGVGNVTAGFHLQQETSISCTVAYAFPPGNRFTPYRDRGAAPALPFWRAM